MAPPEYVDSFLREDTRIGGRLCLDFGFCAYDRHGLAVGADLQREVDPNVFRSSHQNVPPGHRPESFGGDYDLVPDRGQAEHAVETFG